MTAGGALDRRSLLALLAAGIATPALGRGDADAADIADLIGRMTLDEKIGQLTMASANHSVTGPTVAQDLDAEVREGRVGSLFNLWGRDAIRAAQRTAVEDTRLGIPLFFGLDVIHGFRTVFPIPLAEAGAFDPALWQQTARAAAAEAADASEDALLISTAR
jgi:beta-glucosidase